MKGYERFDSGGSFGEKRMKKLNLLVQSDLSPFEA